MAAIQTQRGFNQLFDIVFNGATPPADFRLILITSAAVADVDTNTLSELVEIAAGNGYAAGGFTIPRNATGFPNLTEDDILNRVEITIQTVQIAAAGGPIPASGGGMNQAVLTDGTGGAANVFAAYDVPGAPVTVPDGNTLDLRDGQLILSQP